MNGTRHVVVRADASYHIGHGHVMRCLTLASTLRERGAEVLFVCREHPGHLCDLIESRRFAVHRLAWAPTELAGADRVAWLGATPSEDATVTREVVEALGAPIDWLIADHYAIDAEWERAVRPVARWVLVIDDLADRPHECDLLLDQNYVERMDTRYDGLVPYGGARLLGPAYALLQPEYAKLHGAVTPRAGAIRRVLISFGGADRHNLAGRALSALLSLRAPDFQIDVVLSSGAQNRESVERAAEGNPKVTVYRAVPSLAPLIATADLGIGASGATSWERLCLGLPSLVVTLADNQRPMAAALHTSGFIEWLGDESAVDMAGIASAVGALLERGLDPEWSLRCLELVDGRGAARVATVMTLSSTVPLHARPAASDDESLLLEWANDRTTRNNSFSPQPISAQSHQAWFRGILRKSDTCRLYLVETPEGVSVGQVRFDRRPEGWVIDYAVAPVFRSRGVGRGVLAAALAELREVEVNATVIGEVRRENVASNRVFESLGFRPTESARGIIWSNTV